VSKALAAFTATLDQAVQLPVDESVLDQVNGVETYVVFSIVLAAAASWVCSLFGMQSCGYAGRLLRTYGS
jgi:hypothetical protein